MSRPLRIAVAGGVYHVVARGNAKQLIYLDDPDRLSFLEVVRTALNRFVWQCLTYCLMPNHYHLVLETPRPNLSHGMRQVNGIYAQRFNRRHDRCGHVFQGRFGATLVETDRHMFELIRYVARNPVRAGLVRAAEDWKWGGHAEVLGLATPTLVSVPLLLARFGDGPAETLASYRRFINQEGTRPFGSHAEPIVGGPRFVDEHLPVDRTSAEMARSSWQANRPSLAVLLQAEDRDAAITRAYRDHGYRMKEIAEVLGCHYATISRRIRRFEEREVQLGSMSDCKT